MPWNARHKSQLIHTFIVLIKAQYIYVGLQKEVCSKAKDPQLKKVQKIAQFSTLSKYGIAQNIAHIEIVTLW